MHTRRPSTTTTASTEDRKRRRGGPTTQGLESCRRKRPRHVAVPEEEETVKVVLFEDMEERERRRGSTMPGLQSCSRKRLRPATVPEEVETEKLGFFDEFPDDMEVRKRRRGPTTQGLQSCSRKRPRPAAVPEEEEEKVDFFDELPDDLVVSVLSKLSSSADRPADFMSFLLTCKRVHLLGHRPQVLSKAAASCLAVPAKAWSDSAHRFLKRCVDCGNLEAHYILGMIHFYVLKNRRRGVSLLAKAAMGSHAAALYALAIIKFNGSGGSKTNKGLRVGFAFCARAASLGHVDALREIGHCLLDGYGVRRNVAHGRRICIQANTRELAAAISSWPAWQEQRCHAAAEGGPPVVCCPLLSDYGWNLSAPEPHPASRFLAEWFGARGEAPGEGLRLCSHRGCSRPETRRHEFRRCSVCGLVNYCSRACQALDWRQSHMAECAPAPADRWAAAEGDAAT